MPDIFDKIAPGAKPQGDIFDNLAAQKAPAQPGFVENLGRSAKDYVGGISKAVMSPVKTLNGVGDLVQGGMIKGMKAIGVPGELDAEEQRKVASVDALGQHYKDKYGSLEKVGHTLYTDPVGAASDASMVLGGAGAGLKVAGLPQAAKWANTASQLSNPLVLPGRVAGTAFKAAVPREAMNNMAIKQYEGGLKPPPSWNSVNENRGMIETAMDEGIALPFVGTGTSALKKTQGKIGAIDQEVAATVKQGAAQGKTADPSKVVAETSRTLDSVKNYANPRTAQNTVGDVTREFLESHAGAAKNNPIGNPIPLDRAQAVKSATYKQIRAANYGEFSTPQKEALKDIARGLKNEVYAAYPELKAKGVQEKHLIDLEDALERFSLRQGNRDNMQLGSIAAGAVGGKAAMIAKAALDNPGIKSRIAIALRQASKAPTFAPATPARFRQATNVGANLIYGPNPLDQ